MNRQVIRFLMVGIINTIIGAGIMFIMYNIFSCTYWISSGTNYFFTSILSFFLNKHFTFKDTRKDMKQIIRFVINILICYILAYGIAKPFSWTILSSYPLKIRGNISMLVGMILFTSFNFIGQKFFAFRI